MRCKEKIEKAVSFLENDTEKKYLSCLIWNSSKTTCKPNTNLVLKLLHATKETMIAEMFIQLFSVSK